jgi:glycosyltransferase involved in cell wall biosynthesis
MKKISVIVPFSNAERYLSENLRGLLAQQYPATDYELIMIDNNSTDASGEIVRQYPRVTLLSEKKRGAYAARNLGLAKAQGDIIAFTDADCIPDSDWLSRIASALHPAQVCLVLGQCLMARDTLPLTLLTTHEEEKIDFICRSQEKELYYGYTNNMAVRREVFAQLGNFVERQRGADQIFVRQVVDEYSCDAVRYDPTIRVRHLEMTDVWTYYHKQFLYGRSNRLCNETMPSRPLTASERWQIFCATVRRHRYSPLYTSLLFALLVLGVGWYTLGRWSARWNSAQDGE